MAGDYPERRTLVGGNDGGIECTEKIPVFGALGTDDQPRSIRKSHQRIEVNAAHGLPD
jgi:hypothetical protein